MEDSLFNHLITSSGNDMYNIMKRELEKDETRKEYNKIASQLNIESINSLVDLINFIFRNNSITEQIDKKHIKFVPYLKENTFPVEGFIGIDNIQLTDKKFSEIIFNSIYPKPTQELYVHYTRLEAAKSILIDKKIRLYNLKKNFSAEEFILFYDKHKFTAYTCEYLENLMSNLFAFCFTSVSNKDSKLWERFGHRHKGVKLTFEINSNISGFREVCYSTDDKIKLLDELFQRIKEVFGYPLNFTSISSIGAFYIKGKFKEQQEFRLLINKRTDEYPTDNVVILQDEKGLDYIELRFISEFAELKLKKVTKGSKCSSELFSEIEKILKNKDKYPDEVEIEK